ncbi:MAG: serine/threonine-protein phosphatase [Pirellulales bacterium]|nr:serine/threonine-protein phosphatase [Pirellulales bacterium]
MSTQPNGDIWQHCLEHAALSDMGLRRSNNQDSIAVSLASGQESWNQKGHLFLVADGMGAHAAGELASRMAADTIPLTYRKLAEWPPAVALREAVVAANARIHQRGEASDDFRGMGTTVTTLVLLPEGAVVAHVGDSRAYRLRGQRFEQLTFDHSLVWEMSAVHRVSEHRIPDYVPKNIITRSLGPNAEVEVDVEGPFSIETGDVFLLCSDGLSGPVQDQEMGTIIGCLPPADAARALVDLANLRGGPDNITAIVVRVTGPQVARSTGAEPRAEPRPPARPVHPLLWTLLAVFALGTLGAAAIRSTPGVLAALAGAALAALLVLLQRRGPGAPDRPRDARPLGKGPYRTYDCTPNGEFVDRLARVVGQLSDAAAHEDWQVHWQQFNALRSEADAATFAADYPAAVRLYCGALCFMMDQLRRQRRGHAGGMI